MQMKIYIRLSTRRVSTIKDAMKVFILYSVVIVTFASRQCGENEHYNSCGTACPLTCSNYKDAPLPCFKICNPGCHCDKGYVRSDDGRCVRPEECSASAEPLVKTCLGKPDPGMCEAYFPMWYYDIQTEKCYKFIYGGCQGNGNRYATEEECLQHCGDMRLRQSNANRCELEFESGPCFAYIPRYYFDQKTGKCMLFIYGGCRGNENNFETVEACNQACGVQSAAGVCELEAEVGPCRGYFERYHFNKKSGRCQKFIYGGCGGNENNFEKLEDCKKACA